MTDLSKIPATPHYAIVRTQSVYIPGDDRSRTSPGHGYPAGTEYFTVYDAYTNREEWELKSNKCLQGMKISKHLQSNQLKYQQQSL